MMYDTFGNDMEDALFFICGKKLMNINIKNMLERMGVKNISLF